MPSCYVRKRSIVPCAAGRIARTILAITALGEKAKSKAMDQLSEPPPALLTALTQNEQRTLRDLLRKVRDSKSSE